MVKEREQSAGRAVVKLTHPLPLIFNILSGFNFSFSVLRVL